MNYVVEPLLASMKNGIFEGLATGRYIRWGGVIRIARGYPGAGTVVTHLRDIGTTALRSGSPLAALDTVTNTVGHVVTNVKLDHLQQTVGQVLQMTNVAAAASVLNLGVSAVGFAIMTMKLNKLQKSVNHVLSTVQSNHDETMRGILAVQETLAELRFLQLSNTELVHEAIGAVKQVRRDLLDDHCARMLTDLDLLHRNPDETTLHTALRSLGHTRRWLQLGIEGTALDRDHAERLFDLLLRFRLWCFAGAAELQVLRRAGELEQSAVLARELASQARNWAQRLVTTFVPADELGGVGRFGFTQLNIAAETHTRLARLQLADDQQLAVQRRLAGAKEVAEQLPARGAGWLEQQAALAQFLDFVEEATERLESVAQEMDFCLARRLDTSRWEGLPVPAEADGIALIETGRAA